MNDNRDRRNVYYSLMKMEEDTESFLSCEKDPLDITEQDQTVINDIHSSTLFPSNRVFLKENKGGIVVKEEIDSDLKGQLPNCLPLALPWNSVKRKKDKKTSHFLTFETKGKIIQDFEAGFRKTDLAVKYKTSFPSIIRILKNRKKIIEQCNVISESGGKNEKRKRYSGTETHPFEICLHTWFKQKRSLGEQVTASLLKQKAIYFNKNINEGTSFSASNGWLARFKKRHGILCLDMLGARLSLEEEQTFKRRFNSFLQAEGYDLDNIYNVDETGLKYKQLPNKILAANDERQAFGQRLMQKRVTVLICSNATGTDKLPLMVIGNSLKPKCFKHVQQLPLTYKYQKNAWIDEDIFTYWYENEFLPHIKARKPGCNKRYLLLLDNAPVHLSAEYFDAIEEQCKVFFLPPNVSSLIQPMNQGVISDLNQKYREIFLSQSLSANVKISSQVTTSMPNWSLLNCINALFLAWEKVSPNTLKKAWKQIIDVPETVQVEDDNKNTLFRLINKLPGEVMYNDEDVKEWLNSENTIPVWKKLSDEEIINEYGGLSLDVPSDTTENELCGSDDESDEEIDIPTPSKVINASQTILNWCKTQMKDQMNLTDFSVLTKIQNKILNSNIDETNIEK